MGVMELRDPVSIVVDEASRYFSEVFKLEVEDAFRLIQPPPREEYGDLSFPLLRFTRREAVGEREVVEVLRGRLWEKGIKFIELNVEKGFLNIRFEEYELSRYTFGLMINGWRPEPVKTRNPETIVVEHTSANPVHPLHIGHARNASLGDTLARLLKARGHRVNRRFYIDDVGRQTAVAALGFQLLGVDPLEEARRIGVKPDHLVGWVYAATHTLLDVLEAKKRLEEASGEERVKVQREIDRLMATLARLKEADPGGYMEKLLEKPPRGAWRRGLRRLWRGMRRGLSPRGV